MRKFLGVVLVSLVLFCGTGCLFQEGVEKTKKIFATLAQAEKEAGPVVALLQDKIPGFEGFDETRKLDLINTLSNISNKGEDAQAALSFIAKFLPVAAQKYATGASEVIGLGIGLMGLIGGVIERLKSRKSKKIAVAAMKAGDKVGDKTTGYGSAIAATSTDAGVRDATEKLYLSHVKKPEGV